MEEKLKIDMATMLPISPFSEKQKEQLEQMYLQLATAQAKRNNEEFENIGSNYRIVIQNVVSEDAPNKS